MTSTGYHDTGEEWAQKKQFRQDLLPGNDLKILLYNDSTDSLSDSDDISAITSEPDTNNDYARQSQSVDVSGITVSRDNGNSQSDFAVTFSVSTNSETVDAYGVVVNFESDVAGDSSPSDHLLTTATFGGGSTDLSNQDEIEATVEIEQD